MPFPRHRLLALALLLLWMAPGVAAWATVLHVALDHQGPLDHQGAHGHHGEPGDDHAEEIAILVRSASHGHHHDLTAPEHEHEASLRAAGQLPRSVVPAAAAVTVSAAPAVPDGWSRFEAGSRRALPRPLFATHCSLLL